MTDTVTLRLTIADPVPGLHYWRQDAKNAPHDIRLSTEAPLTFDMPVDLRPDGRLGGTFVRREGKERRFVYIAIGGAMPGLPVVSRRAKIDVHDRPAETRRGDRDHPARTRQGRHARLRHRAAADALAGHRLTLP